MDGVGIGVWGSMWEFVDMESMFHIHLGKCI